MKREKEEKEIYEMQLQADREKALKAEQEKLKELQQNQKIK